MLKLKQCQFYDFSYYNINFYSIVIHLLQFLSERTHLFPNTSHNNFLPIGPFSSSIFFVLSNSRSNNIIINPLTPKISLAIFLTVCHTFLMM